MTLGTTRIAKRRRFVTVDIRTAEDNQLSFRARGVLLWLLAKPDDWSVDSTLIAGHGTEGRDAVRGALRELETAGYLKREKVQIAGGKWVTETVVYEHPDCTTIAESPLTEDGKPVVGAPGVGKPGPKGPNTQTEDSNLKRNDVDAEASTAPLSPAEKPIPPERRLVQHVWEERTRLGLTPPILGKVKGSSFVALVGVARSMLDGGADADALIDAMIHNDGAWTINALLEQMRKRRSRVSGLDEWTAAGNGF